MGRPVILRRIKDHPVAWEAIHPKTERRIGLVADRDRVCDPAESYWTIQSGWVPSYSNIIRDRRPATFL